MNQQATPNYLPLREEPSASELFATEKLLREHETFLTTTSTTCNPPYRSETTRLRLFAKANNFQFFGNVTVAQPLPIGLNIGKQVHCGLVVPNNANGWFELGDADFSDRQTSSQDYRQSVHFTYILARLPRVLPRMAIVAKSSQEIGPSPVNLRQFTVVSPEFEAVFSVYAEPGSEKEMLELLTPDVMAYLIDHYSGYTMFVDGFGLFAVTAAQEDTSLEQRVKNQIEKATNLISELTYQLDDSATSASYLPKTTPEFTAAYVFHGKVDIVAKVGLGIILLLVGVMLVLTVVQAAIR